VLNEIDRYAKRQKISRSEAIRQLVTRALAELKP
jgi:metal-responsive CopG/Arc/MetJ family transcriptional regulator